MERRFTVYLLQVSSHIDVQLGRWAHINNPLHPALPLLLGARLFLHPYPQSPWPEAISGQPCHGCEPAGIKEGPEAQFNLSIRDIPAGARPGLTLWSSRVKKS